MERLFKKYSAQISLNVKTLAYLEQKKKKDYIYQETLKEILEIQESHISRIIKDLTNRSLITKRRDGKRNIIKITETGSKLIRKLFNLDEKKNFKK